MKVSPLNTNFQQGKIYNSQKNLQYYSIEGSGHASATALNPCSSYSSIQFSGIKGYFPNISLSFTGACSNLKKLCAYAPDGTEHVLKKATDGSYLVDAETVTKIYYGKDAEKYLNKTMVFDKDTQIICPHDGELKVEVDGKEFLVESDGAVLLGRGKEAKVTVLKSNPLVLTSERQPVWFEGYSNNSKNKKLQERYEKMSKVYAHFYDGHMRTNILGPEISDKLVNSGHAEAVDENHIKMKHCYVPDYMEKELDGILSKEEMIVFKRYYERTRKLYAETKEARKASAEGLSDELREKLEGHKIITNLREPGKDRIYWRQTFYNERELKKTLQNFEFSTDEQDEVIKFWKRTNKLGFDFSGLKYLSDNVAIYSLKDRINNMTGMPAYWDTTSFVVSSIEEDSPHPYIGVSEKHSDIDQKEPVLFKQIRAAETLHSHSAEIAKHQTEVYIITEGAGAITVIEDGKPKTVVLKQGEGIVLQPGVKHCVSAFKGKYEHLVCQIPSGFHYGPVFKIDHDYPDGYSESKATQMAIDKLSKVQL